jgi:hypothetical protein
MTGKRYRWGLYILGIAAAVLIFQVAGILFFGHHARLGFSLSELVILSAVALIAFSRGGGSGGGPPQAA